MSERGELIAREGDHTTFAPRISRLAASPVTIHTRLAEHVVGERIIGVSAAIRHVREQIARVAPLDLPVLIQGPTGSGKELVARALHEVSGRGGALVAFSVAAIPEPMFEDALFGHTRGAFTGSVSDMPGYLVEADGGTAFFDEIGTLAPVMQPKLLRVLETRCFRPVGAKLDRRSEFRLVSATNEDLSSLVAAGRFRADLAERMSTFVIQVPPLAARPEDIPLLVDHFVRHSAANPLGSALTFNAGAIRALQSYDWPRQVRELRNVVDRALVAAGNDARSIGAETIRAVLAGTTAPSVWDVPARQELLAVLEATGWETMRAAALLGVDRTTVYRRMRRLGIPVPLRQPRGGQGA